jgi:pyrroloquinoline quinone (PQQ) biosynthesis protein C
MARTKAKKEKGHIIMNVYDDYSAIFEIDGDDDWLAAGFAGGLEDERLSKIVVIAAQTLLETRQQKQEEDLLIEKAAKKAAPKKKAVKK